MGDLESAKRETTVPHHDGVVLVSKHSVQQRRQDLPLQLDVDRARKFALDDVVQAGGTRNLNNLKRFLPQR